VPMLSENEGGKAEGQGRLSLNPCCFNFCEDQSALQFG